MFNQSCVLVAVLLCGFACSAQSTPPAPGELELSLKNAIQIATSQQSTAVQRGEQIVNFAKSEYAQARSNLLPFLDGAVTEQNQTVSLRAVGLQSNVVPGVVFPSSVGPFSTFDARIRMTQNILNLSTIRNLQAAARDIRVARADDATIRDQEAGHVAKLYAAALRAETELKVARANISLAEAVRDLASNKRSVGEGTDVEVTRTELGVTRHQQHLIAVESELHQAYLELINVLNLPWDSRLKLTGKLAIGSEEVPTVEDAVRTALQSRADLKGQEERVASAKLKNTAAKLERLPSITGYGDYGVLSGSQTHVAGASLKIPLFDGGRMEADRAQTLSLMRQEEIREKELRRRVELEIRKILDALASKRRQVAVADEAVSFAGDVLARAGRRYEAGVTNSIEMTDAQTQLEVAEDEQVAALFDYTNARIDLAEAMGTIMKLSF